MKPTRPQKSKSSSSSTSKPSNRGRTNKYIIKKSIQSDTILRDDVKSKKEMILQNQEAQDYGTAPFRSRAENIVFEGHYHNQGFVYDPRKEHD